MGYFEAAVLGIVQGLTEFLPISSNAHLRIVGALFGWADPGAAFTAIIQIGHRDGGPRLLREGHRADRRRLGAVAVQPEDAQRPGCPDGLADHRRQHPDHHPGPAVPGPDRDGPRNLWVIATTLIIFGLVLRSPTPSAGRTATIERPTVAHGVIYGLAQSLALIPGVSRSGGTISAGLLLGYTREAAARYSFLLAIPAVLGCGLFERTRRSRAASPVRRSSGADDPGHRDRLRRRLAAIAWLLRYLVRGSFVPFVIYRVVVGLTVLALVGAGVLNPT